MLRRTQMQDPTTYFAHFALAIRQSACLHHIIFSLHKGVHTSSPKEDMIYELDQEYFRCLENIKFYRYKMNSVNSELIPLFADRLTDAKVRLEETKTKLSKTY